MLRQAGDCVECGHERAHLGAREAPKRSIVQDVCEPLRNRDDPLRPKTMPNGVEDHEFFDVRDPKGFTFQDAEAHRIGWGVFTPYKSGIQVVVTAYEINASECDALVQLTVYTRAPRACAADENRALRTTLSEEASKALMKSLHESSTNSRCVAVHSDKSKKIHHPHVLSILARVAQLERVSPIRVEMKDHWESNHVPFVLYPHVQVVAVPPSPVPIEETLCLLGHSKAYVDGICPMDVTAPPYEAISALGSAFVANKLPAQLPLRFSSLELVAERADAFRHNKGMHFLMDRLAIFDWEIYGNRAYVEDPSRRVAGLMAKHCAEMTSKRPPVDVPSPTPSSVGGSPSSPPVVVRPAPQKKPAKKKREESDDESDDDEESVESEEEDSGDGEDDDDDGEDAEEESSSDDDETIQERHERQTNAAQTVATSATANDTANAVTQTFCFDTANGSAAVQHLNALTAAMPLARAFRHAEVTIKYSRPVFSCKRKFCDLMKES